MGTKEDVKKIRKIIKSRCPTVSVRMDRGTSWGWVKITSKEKAGIFTKREFACLKHEFNLRPGSNTASVPPDKHKEFIRNKRLSWGYKTPFEERLEKRR